MVKQISSGLTPVMRYVLVPWAIGAPAIMFVALLVMSIVAHKPIALVGLPVVGCMGLVMAVLVKPFWECRRVGLSDAGLVVGPEDRVVAFREISAVTRSYFTSPPVITVRLHNGERIRFLAMWQLFAFTTPPVVTELKARANLT